MGGSAKKPAQCVVETDTVGYVLSGTSRSLALVIADARRHEVEYVYVRGVGGEPVWLPIRDEHDRPIPWTLREPAWE